MRIDTENISKTDAIEAARNFMLCTESNPRNGGFPHMIEIDPMYRGDFEKLCKVLLVGIGELAK